MSFSVDCRARLRRLGLAQSQIESIEAVCDCYQLGDRGLWQRRQGQVRKARRLQKLHGRAGKRARPNMVAFVRLLGPRLGVSVLRTVAIEVGLMREDPLTGSVVGDPWNEMRRQRALSQQDARALVFAACARALRVDNQSPVSTIDA
jgi:hypothetical protein